MARTQGGLKGILWRAAVRKGFWGGQRSWMTLFAVIATAKALRRISGRTQSVVYTEELLPGQALVITHHDGLRRDGATS
ncbi:MAG TPA: hypothetical protein VM143_03850 [Acidimicrobiales bacterium]|nr:hypothetical protein [Acidimicrobiales bacterium]